MTVLYTPGQLRSAVSIAPETYRHWKKALAPLDRGRGHSPCFSSGDMVATSVIRTLATDLSVRVSALAPIAAALFELCNVSPWPVLERTKVILNLQEAEVRLAAELAEAHSNQPLIIIPLRAIVAHLREQLLAATDHLEQPSLLFPPIPIASAATAQRGRQ
ncbi:MAG: hypothetical protein RIB84_08010 [Sneathiellaceae bacterium]